MRSTPVLLLVLCLLNVAHAQTSGAPRTARLLELLRDGGSGYVMVVAHRGDWRNAPENSLEAIENCIDMGVDIAEIDLRVTKDGQIVLMHDETLDRTTTGKGLIRDHTLAQIKELYLTNGYGVATTHRVPTLEEALNLTRGRILVYLDKSDRIIREAYAVLQATGTAHEAMFYGHRTVAELRRDYPDLADRITYLPKLSDKTPDARRYVGDFLKELSPPAFVVSFREEGSPVLGQFAAMKAGRARVWASPLWPEMCAGRTDDGAVDDPSAHWGWLIERGASILCTDRPQLMLHYLRSRGLHD